MILPGCCNVSSQAMPAPWALQPTKTREPVKRERMSGQRGRHGGLPCHPIPGGSGGRLPPARAATPRISPVPPCPFPPSPGWPQKTSADAERAWRWWGLSAHGERAGGDRERMRGSKPQLWPEKLFKQPSKRALVPLRGPLRSYPREDGCATGCGKDPCGSGQEPVQAQRSWAMPAAPGHACMERT